VSPPRLELRSVAAARLWASAQMPYLAAALFAAPVVLDAGSGTIAVDRRWRVRVDPAVAEGLETAQLGRLLLHLIGHLVRDHADRAELAGVGGPVAERWNRATDAEINDDLESLGLVPSVAPDLPRVFGAPTGQLAEGYFERTADPRPWDCGSGCDARPRAREEGDSPNDGEGLDSGQAGFLRLSVAAAVQQANGREPGSVPGGWLRWAESLLPSRVDWRRVLAAEIRQGIAAVAGAVDYSYRRPSRRARAWPRVVLPSLLRPVPEVTIVCDTSGSMHEDLLARALAEVEGILTKAGIQHGTARVLAVDTNVHAVKRVTSAKQVVLAGGGGTDMGEGITAAVALRPKPSIVVVLTDGFTPWPLQPPKGTRVIVGLLAQGGLVTRHVPDWARTIMIDCVNP
jgi:predicted metal-dependent peptidase